MVLSVFMIFVLFINGCTGITINATETISQSAVRTPTKQASTTNVSLLLSLLKSYKSTSGTATGTGTSTNPLTENPNQSNSTGSTPLSSISGPVMPSPESIQRLREKEDQLMHSGRLLTPFQLAMRQGRVRTNLEAPANKMMEMMLLLSRVEMAQTMGCKTLGDVLELEGMENIPLNCARRCPMGTSCKMVGPIGLCCPRRGPVPRMNGYPPMRMNFGASF